MTDIRQLLNQVAAQEVQLRDRQFLAPCVRGGRVRTRVAAIVCTFATQPRDFEGWGIFQPVDDKTAKVIAEASLPQIAEYLKLFKPLRLRLIRVLQGQTWLAYPVNESDAKQRFGIAQPVPVHLVTEGNVFETIIACWDGGAWWFNDIDRRADPLVVEELLNHLKELTLTAEVQFKGISPEMRTVYDLAIQPKREFQQQRDEKRLRRALQQGGGDLQKFGDRGEFWQVEWTTGDGQRHTSAIAKNDLTVVSSGICLSGKDADFDLQSLVGVIEGRDN
jgi:hypothetical protein